MVAILLLALLGIADAGYLVLTAARKRSPVCPFGQSCTFVLGSRFNHMLGVKNEILGLVCYAATAGAAAATLFGIVDIPRVVWVAAFGLAVVASFLLTGIQVFILRAYCSWCLASAGVNVLLLLTAMQLPR